jgi:hypothetical protein
MHLRNLLIAIAALCLPALAIGAEPVSFDKGAWTLEMNGTYMHNTALGDVEYVAPSVGVGYYLIDNLAHTFELTGYHVNTENDNALAASFNLGLRYHLFRWDRMSLYADLSAGVFYASNEVPDGGTHFNFITRSGWGITYELRENMHLTLGGRFLHISNARIHGSDRNPSTNGVEGYIGLIIML